MDEAEERRQHQAEMDLFQSLGATYTDAYVSVIKDRLATLGFPRKAESSCSVTIAT